MKLRERIARGIVAMAGWGPTPQSSGGNWSGSKFAGASAYPPQWNADFFALRQRSRQARFESSQGRALVKRLLDSVINSGLMLEASPQWEIIDPQNRMDDETRRAWVKEVQARFDLWMRSTHPDCSGRMTGYQLQGFEFLNRLIDGETFPVIRYSTSPRKLSPVEIQFVQPDQIQTPFGKGAYKPDDVTRIIDGIEIDSSGKELAFHIQDPISYKFTRMPVMSPSGARRFCLHPAIIESVGQVRGMPLLAPFVHELQKITDYSVAELEAAILNASIAAWVEPSDTADSSRPMKGNVLRTGSSSQTAAPADPSTTIRGPVFDAPGLFVQNLRAGEKINSYDTKRPNVNFDGFVMGVMKHLSASLGMPLEVLLMSFNANYSASRASLVLFWNVVENWRYDAVAMFQNPIYEAWLQEEISAARIVAPGFDVPLLRAAWLRAEWTGINKPSIDPLKEANAAKARIDEGLSTRERESLLYNGSDYSDNIARLMEENEHLAEVNKPLVKLNNSVYNGADADGNPLTDDPQTPAPGAKNGN